MTIAELDSPQTCPSSIVEMCRGDLQSMDHPRNRLRKARSFGILRLF